MVKKLNKQLNHLQPNLEEGDEPETKTEKLDEVVVTAKKDRSREAIKNRKAKMKKDGKSKREIRLAKTKR